MSNDELLSILSETKDVTLVQPHLKKCFEGINAVTFEDDLTITEMISSEKEHVPMSTPVDPKKKNVEAWMTEVELQMKESIREIMHDSIKDYVEVHRTEWMVKWPGMCVLNASQLYWTKEMEESMDMLGADGIKKEYEKQVLQLADMTRLVRGELNKMARTTVGALAVIDVHARDVTMKLVNNKVSSKVLFCTALNHKLALRYNYI